MSLCCEVLYYLQTSFWKLGSFFTSYQLLQLPAYLLVFSILFQNRTRILNAFSERNKRKWRKTGKGNKPLITAKCLIYIYIL